MRGLVQTLAGQLVTAADTAYVPEVLADDLRVLLNIRTLRSDQFVLVKEASATQARV